MSSPRLQQAALLGAPHGAAQVAHPAQRQGELLLAEAARLGDEGERIGHLRLARVEEGTRERPLPSGCGAAAVGQGAEHVREAEVFEGSLGDLHGQGFKRGRCAVKEEV